MMKDEIPGCECVQAGRLRTVSGLSCHADGMAQDVCGGGGSFGRRRVPLLRR